MAIKLYSFERELKNLTNISVHRNGRGVLRIIWIRCLSSSVHGCIDERQLPSRTFI